MDKKLGGADILELIDSFRDTGVPSQTISKLNKILSIIHSQNIIAVAVCSICNGNHEGVYEGGECVQKPCSYCDSGIEWVSG